MKKLLLFAALALSSSLMANAQEVASHLATPPFISEVKAKIEAATGHALREDGDWVRQRNVIPSALLTSKQSESDKKLGQENFTSIELKEVQILGEQYALMIVKYLGARYEFPTLQLELSTYEILDFYVFRASKLKELLHEGQFAEGVTAVNLDVFSSGTITDYTTRNVESEIAFTIQSRLSRTRPDALNMIMAVQLPENDDKNVRFRMLRTYSQKFIYQTYLQPTIRDQIFNRAYYELPANELLDFLNTLGVYDRIRHEMPSDYDGFIEFGMMQYRAGEYFEAIGDFSRAIRLNPNEASFIAFAFRGNAKHRLGDFEAAIEDFDHAIGRKPVEQAQVITWAMTFHNRAASKFLLRDTKGACEDWLQALEYGVNESEEYINRYCRRMRR